ncbi:hypothetical protein CIB48_g1152, partial [Xylaria polymorpha]
MAISNDKQVKEGKKRAEKQVKRSKIMKPGNPVQKRGQPTAAARLISSPYIKFGWHKTLGADVKEIVQDLGPQADSMYMLQISRDRPINSLSLRNGIFWEHRQLKDESIVSTPALDHIDLFPVDDEAFQDTLRKIGKRPDEDDENGFLVHYLFEEIRYREFLLLPIEVTSGDWVTIITRTRLRLPQPGSAAQTDRDITDFAIVDPQPHGREAHLASSPSSNWQSGLVAYEISREFLRRLKTLQFRKSRSGDSWNGDEDFLWAAFEEDYNFDVYRQNMISACAHQTIETSGFRVRLALEVPSDDSNYQPSLLHHDQDEGIRSDRDEKWGIFQSPTHIVSVDMVTGVDVCLIPVKNLHKPKLTTTGSFAKDNHPIVEESQLSSPPETKPVFKPVSYTTTSPGGDCVPDEPST